MNRRLLNVIVTEISEQLNDLIKIKTEHGTIQCCPASEHLLNRPNSCILGIDSWTWTVWTVLSSALCSKMFTSWNTCCLKIKHKRKVSALFLIVIIIFAVRLSYSMYQWITHVWLLWVWINIAFWSLYCALFLHKNELFLTVDIANDACVPPGVIS